MEDFQNICAVYTDAVKIHTRDLKDFKMATVTYLTSLNLEDDPLWIKKYSKRLLNWINVNAPEIWLCHVQLSISISSELKIIAQNEFGFLLRFRLWSEHNGLQQYINQECHLFIFLIEYSQVRRCWFILFI